MQMETISVIASLKWLAGYSQKLLRQTLEQNDDGKNSFLKEICNF
jgi:hypothetical protein